MKELSELNLPQEHLYTKNHEWINPAGKKSKAGISDYAQDQLGEIVFVELPEEGDSFNQGDEFGTVESVKAVSELYMPVSGEIVAVNKDLEDAPELVNSSPYKKGWMIEIKPSNPEEQKTLMNKSVYLKLLEGIE